MSIFIQTIPYDPVFEDMLRLWLKEWEQWSSNMTLINGSATNYCIDKQQQSFRLWLSIQKDIIVLDMYRDKEYSY